VRLAERVLSFAMAAILFAAMLIIVVDVTGRYLFARPLTGADDLIGIIMALAVFTGLPIVTARGQHVKVDFGIKNTPSGFRRVLDVVFAVIGAGVLALISYQTLALAGSMADFGDTSPMLKIPLAPVATALAVLALVAAVAQVARLLGFGAGDVPASSSNLPEYPE
jgi:TRAP-type C4-dicarboxylate transport system permease small subunit